MTTHDMAHSATRGAPMIMKPGTVPGLLPALLGGNPGQDITPVMFVDLDDTVRWGRTTLGRFVNGPQDVTIFPEAITMMARWKARGGRVVSVSNQGGVGLGIVDGQAMLDAMHETDRLTGNLFDLMTWCPHAPHALCWCRKPMPGMLYAAMAHLMSRHAEVSPREHCLMVGDRDEDKQCAAAAGIPFMDAVEWRAQAHQAGTPS